MSWNKIRWLDSWYWCWYGLVSSLYFKTEMVSRYGFLSLHCGSHWIWTLDIARESTLYLVSLNQMQTSLRWIPFPIESSFDLENGGRTAHVYPFGITYTVSCIAFCVFSSFFGMFYESRKPQGNILVRVWFRIWVNKMVVWEILCFVTNHQNLALLNKRMVILVSSREWRLFGKIWYNDYHNDTELRWCPFVLHTFGEYLNVVLIWWLWI